MVEMIRLLWLITILVVLTFFDVRHRRIPIFVWGPLTLLTIAGGSIGMWPLSVVGAMVGYGSMWIADLPGGDRRAAGLIGLMVGGIGSVFIMMFSLGSAALYVHRYGWKHHMIGTPFIPWLAVTTGIVYGSMVLYRSLSSY